MKYIFLLTLLTLVSCSSAKKRAIELSEKGQYEAAVAEFEKALKDDPNDAEALEGMKKSQEMALNNRLVQLRNFRNSNEHIRALDSLKALVDLQKKWNYSQDVNSAAFQGKETALLWNPFKTEVAARIKKGHALSAVSMYNDFKDIFAFTPKGELEAQRVKIFAAGKKSCRAFKDSVSFPYLASFHNRYCDYFGVDKTSKVVYTNVFHSIKWIYELQGTPNNSLKLALLDRMATSFAGTPWFNNSVKAELPLLVTGNYVRKTDKEQVNQFHEYSQEEPYDSYEQVKKTRTNSLGQIEEYYENEKVTRHRTVRKVFQYPANKLSQTIDFDFKAEFDLVKQKHLVGLEKNFTEEMIVHDYNMPNIHLLPSTKRNLEPEGNLWAKYSEEAALRFKEKLIKIWETEYCVLPETLNHAFVSENVLRCRKSVSAKNSDFVNTWFLNNYGIPNATVEKVLGHF